MPVDKVISVERLKGETKRCEMEFLSRLIFYLGFSGFLASISFGQVLQSTDPKIQEFHTKLNEFMAM